MKKFFSLILVAMLSLSPIYTFAAEDTQALTPAASETPAESVTEAPAPEVSSETSTPAVSEETTTPEITSEAPAEGGEKDGANTKGEPSQEKSNTDGVSDGKNEETKPSTDVTNEGTEKGTEKKTGEADAEISAEDKEKDTLKDSDKEDLEDKDKEKTEEELEKERLEKELKEKEELEKLRAKKRAEIPDHVHEFKYTSNGDGTHTVTCIAKVVREKVAEEGSEETSSEFETEEVDCDYNEIEECEYDENGVCKYCEAIKPKEKFNPSISIAISNGSCTIGESNPIIALVISQKDFDIEYAQICFANYSHNQFINVALAQGQYYNHKDGEFVYTGNSGWYASPDISEDYNPGRYSVRSIFVRSANGETVHYSVESGNLPEGLQNNTIELQMSTSMSLIRNVLPSSNSSPELVEPPVIEEPADEVPDDEPYGSDKPVYEEHPEEEIAEPRAEEEVEEKAEEPEVVAPVSDEKPEDSKDQEPIIEEPVVGSSEAEDLKTEQPKQAETPKAEENSTAEEKTTTENNSTTAEKSTTEDRTIPDSNSNNDDSTTKSNVTENKSSNQESTSNKLLKFFKSLFGLR